MKKFYLLLGIILTGIGVAFTYHIFENAVHGAIDLVWYDWFNTDNARYWILPLCIVIGLAYFGIQHYLDPESENLEEQGLGGLPQPKLSAYAKVLFIGFFSLVAGASLGPEAVLVPACMILGGLVGGLLFAKEKQMIKLLAAAGFIALFTAFFNSIIVGVLSVLIVTKQAKTKLSAPLLAVAILAATSAFLTLKLISAEAFTQVPDYSWHINAVTVFWVVILALAGFLSIFIMNMLHKWFDRARAELNEQPWIARGLVASGGLALLYLLGGPLIEFTGNRSIIPMLQQSASLGTIGLIWILVTKLGAIGWSKALGYRGGMIFPTIFVAAVLVAMVQLNAPSFNFIYGIIAAMIGAFAANRRWPILF